MKISYDLHLHSCLSPCGDNDMTPNNIVNMAVLLGLDAIAVSDHNSSLNLPAIFNVANEHGLTVVPALEVCTSEEVHLLCMTYTLQGITELSDELYQFLPDFKNNVEVFGQQLIVDENDNIIGSENRLLINALTLNIDKLLKIIAKYDGIAIPAHVDKTSNSIISNLGFIPPDYNFSCIEIKNPKIEVNFDGKRIINSDAHYLEHIHEPIHFLDVMDNSARSIINYLKSK
ncbi:MAG: PHP domain-containing protein [Oscillospiraceae bacterium]